VFVIATSPHAVTKIKGSEVDALLKWKASFDNQSKTLISSWIGNNPCSSWEGITCDYESKSVNKVNLTNIGLKGTLQTSKSQFLITSENTHLSFNKQLLLRSCSTPYWSNV